MNGDRLPPHDIDAEEAVIGSLLIDGEAIHKISGSIEPSDFYSERNLLVFEACNNLYQRTAAINQITVAQELSRTGKLETSGGAAYLSHIISVCPTSLDIEDYSQIVYRLSLMRRLIRAADRISDIGYKADPDADSSLDKAEDEIYRLRHGQRMRDFVHIRQALDSYLETPVKELSDSKETLPYVPTDFTGLDDILGGLQRSDLIILAARPAMGKTSLALNIARNAAVNHHACVAFFSLEMSVQAMVLRLLSGEAEINSRRLRRGLFYEEGEPVSEEEKKRRKEEETRILEATGILSEAAIYIDDSPLIRIVEMRSKARRLYYERGIDLIIVDYLQLLQGDTKNENRVQEISYISRSLKILARELNVPVIAVSQLSRAVEFRSSHRPQLSDLRESGSLEQDADVVMFVYRDDMYHSEEEWRALHEGEVYPPPAEIIISKHRNGPTGEVQLRFKRSLAKFLNTGQEQPHYETI